MKFIRWKRGIADVRICKQNSGYLRTKAYLRQKPFSCVLWIFQVVCCALLKVEEGKLKVEEAGKGRFPRERRADIPEDPFVRKAPDTRAHANGVVLSEKACFCLLCAFSTAPS